MLSLTVALLSLALGLTYFIFRLRYRKAGPDEALIVYGRRALLGAKVRDETGRVEGFRIAREEGPSSGPPWRIGRFSPSR